MNTPRLPAMVRSQQTAKRSAFCLPALSTRAKTPAAIQTSAAAASSIAPGRSRRKLMRKPGSSTRERRAGEGQKRGGEARQRRERRHRQRGEA